MKKIALRVLIGIGVLVLGLAVIPFFINLNDYKSDIEKKLSETLGRPLSIGQVSVQLLPLPVIRLQEIKVANLQGASLPHMAEIETAKVELDILPLLKKHIRLSHVSVINPTVHLEKVQGKANWEFPTSLEKEDALAPTSSGPAKTPPVTVAIDQIEVLKGGLTYRDGPQSYALEDLTATAYLKGLQGPLQTKGYVKIQGRDLNFDVYIKEFSDDLPLKISLDSVGLEGSIDGKFSLKAQTFKGDVEAKTHGGPLGEFLKKDIYISEFLKEALTARAHIIASPESVDLQNLELEIDDQKISGLAQLSFAPFKVSLDLRGFPGGTSLSASLAPAGRTTNGAIKLDSSNPKKFLTWLKLPTDFIHEDFSSKLKFNTDVSLEKNFLSLKRIALTYRQASLEGSLKMNMDSWQASYDLSLNHFSPLLKTFGIDLQRELGQLLIKGNTTLKGGLQTNSSLDIKGLHITLSGSVDGSSSSPLKGTLKIDADNLTPLFLALSGTPAPLKSLYLNTGLEGTLKLFSLKNLQASLGMGSTTVKVGGNLMASLEDKLLLKGNLTIPELKTDLLVSKNDNIKGDSHPKFMLASANDKPQGPPVESPPFLWSKTSLDLTFLKSFNMDIDLDIHRLGFKQGTIDALKGKIKLAEGNLAILNTAGSCFGGTFNLEASLQNASTPTFKMAASLKEAEVKNLLSQEAATFKVIAGKLDSAVNILSKGDSLYGLISNLKGQASLNGKDGVLQGISLRTLSDKLKKINNLEAVVDLLSAALSKGQTKFSQLTAVCEFEKGIGAIRTFTLTADGGEGTATGRINLPAFTLDIQGKFTLTDHPQLPPFGLHVYGPLNNPQKKIDSKALQTYLIQNVFKGLLEKGNIKGSLGGLVDGLLGKTNHKNQSSEGLPADQSSDQEPSPSPSEPVENLIKKPEKAIKSLLNGLF